MSDDGRTAIVVIALLGNPFSPSYARARESGDARALDFCTLNVCLYHSGASRWALDERRIGGSAISEHSLTIGRSSMRWESDALVFDLAERTPLGRSVRGRILLRPETLTETALAIDARGDHLWWPVAPLARIEVELVEPALRFTGNGYHDANAGVGPIDAAFRRWSWSRARSGGEALLTYDVLDHDGTPRAHAFAVERSGAMTPIEGLSTAALPKTAWGIDRTTLADGARSPRVVRGLEDGPFYARALVAKRLAGRDVLAVHETLDGARLSRRWVRFLTQFRMRRRA